MQDIVPFLLPEIGVFWTQAIAQYKVQLVVTPDGLIALLFGPINGWHHNLFMLQVSHLSTQLNTLMPLNGMMYTLYGNPRMSAVPVPHDPIP